MQHKSRRFKTIYSALHKLSRPLNRLLAVLLKHRVYPDSVLHICYMNHIPLNMVHMLKKRGLKAAYLAIGRPLPVWNRADFHLKPCKNPFRRCLREFRYFWGVVSKYRTVHYHFADTMSLVGWELEWLDRMDRKIVAYFGGCEIRDRKKNTALHPAVNICQECDYHGALCTEANMIGRRDKLLKYADICLVTTPDMLDFLPHAVQFPLFSPDISDRPRHFPGRQDERNGWRILHVTNHPGIEGTREIERVIARLRERGFKIDFHFLSGVNHHTVLEEIPKHDLTIGKMKMGYYANFQIESLMLGVPAVTWIRPEFVTDAIENSGFINCTLNDLEDTLADYLTHTDRLKRKQELAEETVHKLHDNEALTDRLMAIYGIAGKGGLGVHGIG